MKESKKARLSSESDWIASLVESVKEDRKVIKELAEHINNKSKVLSVKDQVSDILEDAAYAKMVINSPVDFTMTSMAKELGMTGAPRLQTELEGLGIIYRQGKVNHIASEYASYGLTAYRIYKGEQLMVWTQKGRVWLHNLVKRGLLMTEPRPRKEYVKHKKGKYSDDRKNTTESKVEKKEIPKPVRNTEMLMNLIDQMQGYFECVVSLAKECVRENDDADCRLLRGDIRSINDSAVIMMRQLENECYKALA